MSDMKATASFAKEEAGIEGLKKVFIFQQEVESHTLFASKKFIISGKGFPYMPTCFVLFSSNTLLRANYFSLLVLKGKMFFAKTILS